MTVAIVVAVSENHVIGKKGALPWNLPGDLKFFKELTMGQVLVMGRKTQEAIGRVLPGRKNVVVTRNPEFKLENAIVAPSIETALEMVKDSPQVFIIGGGNVYQQALEKDVVDLVYLTRVHGSFEGDAFFYPLDSKKWEKVSERKVGADAQNAYAYTLETHIRKR